MVWNYGKRCGSPQCIGQGRSGKEAVEGNLWFTSRIAERDNPDLTEIVGEGGLNLYKPSSKTESNPFIKFPEIKGLTKNDIYSIYEDKKGIVWIGATRIGLYRYDPSAPDGERFTLFDKSDRADINNGLGGIKNTKMKRITFLLFVLLIQSCEQDGNYYYESGMDLQQQEKYEQSIDQFTKGIQLNDEYKVDNLMGRATSYYHLSDFANSQKDLLDALTYKESNTAITNRNIHWSLGRIAESKGNSAIEIQHYEKAMEWDSSSENLQSTYSLSLIERGDPSLGIEMLDELISSGYEHAFTYNNRALGLIKTKRFDEALADLKKSKEMNSENPFLYKNYCLYYLAIADTTKACESIDKALSLNALKYGFRKDIKNMRKLKIENCNKK